MMPVDALLLRVHPFQFLSADRRAWLAERMVARRYADGEVLVKELDESREVFVIATGAIEAVDDLRDPPVRLSVITAGHYIGERSALFEAPRQLTLRAVGDVEVQVIAADAFLALVQEEPAFAQALARALTGKQGIFGAYRHMQARVYALLDRREFLHGELLPAYRKLMPALHPKLAEDEIDVGALGYVVARLPEGVTRTCFYYLTTALPELYQDPDDKFDPVPTKARRRASWEPMSGKHIVLLRDGISDVTDLLTCLCGYAIEARKLRHRLRSGEILARLRRLTTEPEPEEAARELLAELPLSPEERRGLISIWGDRWWREVRNILLHHEDIAVECDIILESYNSSAAETWTSQVREKAAVLVDLDNPELEVHIISSNTHSVSNCLSPYLAKQADAILTWGREHYPHVCGMPTEERPWGAPWAHREDLVYALGRYYLEEVPGAYARWDVEERNANHRHLDETAFTGIAVDLFDLSGEAGPCDPLLPTTRPERPTLIVNVDYAFGQQAEQILASLLFLFGPRVRSVNVMGKAGGLVGGRGDVQLAESVLLQSEDQVFSLPNRDLDVEELQALIPDRRVFPGRVLTVAGTLLQDRTLLHFYQRIYGCIGLEMEGSFFMRQLQRAIQTGVVRPDVKTRFAYYTSDLPLEPAHNLSEGMAAHEGVPPLYGITRAMLRRILAPDG